MPLHATVARKRRIPVKSAVSAMLMMLACGTIAAETVNAPPAPIIAHVKKAEHGIRFTIVNVTRQEIELNLSQCPGEPEEWLSLFNEKREPLSIDTGYSPLPTTVCSS